MLTIFYNILALLIKYKLFNLLFLIHQLIFFHELLNEKFTKFSIKEEFLRDIIKISYIGWLTVIYLLIVDFINITDMDFTKSKLRFP